MNIRFYFPYLIEAIAQNFEYWAVYESRLDEAVIGLLLWQLLEDGISHVIRSTLPNRDRKVPKNQEK
jgi:hypothetical protein